MVKALPQSEHLFRGLLEAAPDAMIIVDEGGRIQLANSQSERLFGWSRQELLGRPVELLIPERFAASHAAHRDGYSCTPRPRNMGTGRELYGRRKDGTEFPVEVSLSPLDTPEGLLVTAAVRDITRRRLEALTASAAKSDLIAELSHDTRTPLNAILGMADLLGETRLDAEQAEYARVISISARRLLSYVNDALDAVRLEVRGPELDHSAFDVGAEVRQTVELLTPLAAHKGLTLRVEMAPDLPASVLGDAGRLRNILMNLLGNAIKCTERGYVLLRLARSPDDPSRRTLLFSVTDTGVGIPADRLDDIFEPFARVGHRRPDSSGLGLWLVRRLVTLMGGRVWVASVPDEGSTFSFTLPVEIP